MTIPLDTPVADTKVRGFYRNAQGKPVVTPAPGSRFKVYDGCSDWWPFDRFTPGGSTLAADRGTHVHWLTELHDTGRPIDDDTLAAGEALGINRDLQLRIVAMWAAFRDAIGLEVVDCERTVVNDRVRAAGTLDRRVRFTKPLECSNTTFAVGDVAVLDIKTGRTL